MTLRVGSRRARREAETLEFYLVALPMLFRKALERLNMAKFVAALRSRD